MIMSLKELEGFLNDKKKAGDEETNWEDHKKEWMSALDEFYANVTTWLNPLVGANLSLDFETIVLQEEHIGAYETRKMYIYAKGQKVVIEPKGTLIIGAKGRIDMIGSYGRVRFVYVDKRLTRPNISVRLIDTVKENALQETKYETTGEEPVEYEWKIATMPPNIQYIPLNAETFSNSLLSVIQYD